MGEENNFYLAPWVREYKEKEKARKAWLLLLAEKYALSVEDSKHPNGHYMNEIIVTPLGTSLGTVSSDAMLDNLVSTLRKSAAKERKLSREMILHIHKGLLEATKWLAPLVVAPAVITTGGPIMQMLARPLTTTARVASTVFPKVSRVLPYTLMADRGIMGYLGTTGMYNTGKKWYKGEIPWYSAVPLMALEGLMVADAAPLVKVAGKAAIKGADYATRRMYASLPEEALQILPKLQTIEISPEELYKFFLNQKDYYFMGHGTARTNVTPETIFESGLRIKNGEISNTTSPISETNLANWPHLNSEEIIILPGKVSSSKYDSVYGYIPSDWYSSDVFHWTDNPEVVGYGPFAVRNPNATFTEITRNGIPGVFTKPEAILGSYNTRTHILKLNPNSLYLFSFDTAPKVDERLLAILNATPESVLLSFESRLPYATNANKPLVRALPGNRQNNLEIVDNFMNKLKIDHPNATDKELEDIFYLTYGVTTEDVLDSHGMSITDDVTGKAEIVRYDNTRSPLRNMLTKTHEENHTMFNLHPEFFKHETVTAMRSPGGYTKNYLNENAGFKLPDLSTNNPEFELAEYLEAMEISSYMSEYKSLLGKQKNEPLTEEDIKWFIAHKDIVGNKIGGGKYYDYIAKHIIDPKKFAKWATEFSNTILLPVMGGSSLLYLSDLLKYKQGGKIDLLLFLRKGKSIKVKNYPIVDALSEGLEDWFKLNPEVAGMAIGKGLNGIKGKRRIVINPFSNALQTEEQKKGLVLLESVRHAMDRHKYHPNFELTPTLRNLQLTKFKDLNLPYAYDDEAFKKSIISRILVGDDWDLDVSKELLEEAKKFKFK